MKKAYIINTNRSNRPNGEDELDMVTNKKCAAYFSPWKEEIEKINPHDMIFLYSNGKGIIARGVATGIPELTDYTNDLGLYPDEQIYMELDRFETLEITLTSREINSILGRTVVLAKTQISLNNEEGLRIWRHITKHHIKRRIATF